MSVRRAGPWFCLLAACAGPSAALRGALERGALDDALGAYERAPSPAALTAIAEAVLEGEARASEARRRDAAFGALGASGTHAADLLERLTSAPAPAVRARALALLARLGDEAARYALAAHLDDADPEAHALAIEVLDPDRDVVRLQRLTQSPNGTARLAAVRALGRAPPDATTRLLLERIARRDPRADVRAGALAALVAQGPSATGAIESGLDDTTRSVRFAAIAALLAVEPARAEAALDRWLANDPSPEGIEAARLTIAMLCSEAPAAARAQLARALEASDTALRAQAAVALSTLDARDLARARIGIERERSVRLALALALGTDDARARETLASLMAARDVVAVQAASALARHGDDTAREMLLTLRTSDSAAVRRTVVRTLARDLKRAHDVREALLDADRSVRLSAAAAILVGAG